MVSGAQILAVLKAVADLVPNAIRWLFRDRRKTIDRRQVVIGTHTVGGLSVDIRATIVLGETIPPNPGIFLDRVDLERPYCTTCSSALESVHPGTWMSDGFGVPPIFRCGACGVTIDRDLQGLANDVSGAVRRDFFTFWNRYQDEINALTRGKPAKYKLPE